MLKKIIITLPLIFLMFGCETKDLDSDKEQPRNYHGEQQIEYSWAYDVSDYEKIIENSDGILKVKIQEIGDGTFKYSTGDGDYPISPIKVEVLDVLYGTTDDKNITEIYQAGGDVTITQMIDYYSESKINKMGLDTIDAAERDKTYVSYDVLDAKELEVGKTYIVCLKNKVDNQPNFISASGYSVFELEDNENYKNIVTDKIVSINEFKK